MSSLRTFCSQANCGSFGPDHALRPLWQRSASRERWEKRLRPALATEWGKLLGYPSCESSEWIGPIHNVGVMEGPGFHASAHLQPSGPNGQMQKVVILRPHRLYEKKVPCAVVPFYHAEPMAGLEPDAFEKGLRMATPPLQQERELRFGLHLVRMGMIVACVEAFPYNTVADPGGDRVRWWHKGADRLLESHPHWSGIGKLAADTSLALDLLLEQPGVDLRRVLALGHSLGGKMAFYAGAFDSRVTCVIGSDFGMPWRATNWDAPWYHGEPRVSRAEAEGMAHHQLLALLAPRPFLLLAGETDTVEAWQYLKAARPVYALYGAETQLGCLHHATGHDPSRHVLDLAYGWLGEVFRLPHRRWRDEA